MIHLALFDVTSANIHKQHHSPSAVLANICRSLITVIKRVFDMNMLTISTSMQKCMKY